MRTTAPRGRMGAQLRHPVGLVVLRRAGVLQHLRTLGDPAAVERFREIAKQLISSTDLLGVDLTEVKLTGRGIQRR
jgi:hypothetical protein